LPSIYTISSQNTIKKASDELPDSNHRVLESLDDMRETHMEYPHIVQYMLSAYPRWFHTHQYESSRLVLYGCVLVP